MTKKEFDRFWDKIEVDNNDCWNWMAHRNSKGYGMVGLKGKVLLAHRASYEHFKGKIKYTIDHLCRNRACVNPDHLEDVTIKENTHRGNTLAAENLAKTHCKKGHEYSQENTYINPKSGKRTCRKCNYQSGRKWLARKKKED